MKKRYSTRRITSRRSYSTLELAKLLGTHPQTVRTWRTKGLQPIDDSTHSPLFFGSDVKLFLTSQQQKRKTPLQPDQFYCLRCKGAVKANNLSSEETGNTIGGKYQSIIFTGLCQKCGSKVRRFGIVTNQLSSGQEEINIEPSTLPYLNPPTVRSREEVIPVSFVFGIQSEVDEIYPFAPLCLSV